MTPASRWLAAWRRSRLGTRLALALAALALVVFAVVGVVTVSIMRGYLSSRLDDMLIRNELAQLDQLRMSHEPPHPMVSWYSATFQVSGDRVASPKPGGVLPQDLSGLSRAAAEAGPDLVLRTIYIAGQGSYRVRACPIDAGEVLVTAAPQADLDLAVNHLITVEVVAFLLALAVLVLTGRIVLRRGLRPLNDMAAIAHNIATHDLTEAADLPVRASGSGGGAEVGELRIAFNLMLEHIDASLAARTAANDRLRRFIADASHELRTPLTSVRGYADLFRYAAANEPAERDSHLAKLREETMRMSVLVDDLLLLARLDETGPEALPRREEIDVAEVASAAAHAFRTARPDHPLTVELDSPSAILRADPVRLRQILDNLLTNAAIHTPEGTPVTLSVEVAEGVTIRVLDQGPGIAAEDHARIFDRFYRADNSRTRGNGGTGLGLAVVRSLVDAQGGTVEVASEPGRTVFTVWLPLGR